MIEPRLLRILEKRAESQRLTEKLRVAGARGEVRDNLRRLVRKFRDLQMAVDEIAIGKHPHDVCTFAGESLRLSGWPMEGDEANGDG